MYPIGFVVIFYNSTVAGNTENFQDLFALTGNLDIGNMCLAFYAMLYAYNGWYVLFVQNILKVKCASIWFGYIINC